MKKRDMNDHLIKKYENIRWGILGLLCVVVLAVAGTLSASATDEEVEAARDRVEEAEKKARDLQEAKEQFADYLEELNGQLEELTAELEDLAARRSDLEADLEVTAKELLEAKETESSQYEAMKKRIQYMYENGDTGFIELVFSEESISAILNKAEYALELAEYDRNMLKEYQETKEIVAKKEEDLRTAQAGLDKVIAETEEKQNEILAAVGETTEKMEICASELEGAEDELASYRAELQRKELEAEERMARLAEEARKREEEEEQRRQQQLAAAGVGSGAAAPGTAVPPTGTPETTAPSTEPPETAAPSTGIPETTAPPTEPPETTAPPASNPSSGSDAFDYSAYSDVELLAAMIYREAGGEPWKGKVAVGNVVMNRINSRSYPGTMYGVLSQPYQFSPWDGPKYRQALQNGVGGDCRRAAEVAMSGSENYIGGLLHFRTVIPGYTGIVIGGHVFY